MFFVQLVLNIITNYMILYTGLDTKKISAKKMLKLSYLSVLTYVLGA